MMYPEHYKHPRCNLCGQALILITQIYCPLEKREFHRTLYVFGCVNKSCWNKQLSWTILRSQIPTRQPYELQSNTKTQPEPVTMATDEWCDDADDWGIDDGGDDAWSVPTDDMIPDERTAKAKCSNESDIESAELSQRIMGINLQSNSNHKKELNKHGEKHQQAESELLKFQSYFVNVFDESESYDTEITAHEQKLIKEYEKREGVNFREWQHGSDGATGGKRGGAESYEKADVKHGDKYFHKFSKKLALCPEQCIRYSLNGSPLFLTSPNQSNLSIPCCDHCGASRIFELQLMPGMVSLLKVSHDADISIEFGVVLVYTCRDSCWGSSRHYLPEYAIVQADPDQEILRKKQEKSLPAATVMSSEEACEESLMG
ncbi:programmed cell death protein 2-like isoform X2 [Amphiura filiformis]